MRDPDYDLKREFATELLRLGSPDVAARHMFPDEPRRSMLVAMAWPTDDVVVEAMSELQAAADPKKPLLPTKENLLRELWYLGTDRSIARDTKDRITALGKFAEVAGMIDKQPANVVNVGLTNKVMVVPAEMSLDDWEKKAVSQQQNLINEAQGDATKH
jgi:hypothetical protein